MSQVNHIVVYVPYRYTVLMYSTVYTTDSTVLYRF